jgi:hypothetical protein
LYFYSINNQGVRRALWKTVSSQTEMSCRFLRDGVYGVARDTTPPTFTVAARSGKLKFTLADAESHIDDSSIRCKIDEAAAIADYEYEDGGGWIWTQSRLSKGKHNVKFEASNRAGLKKTWELSVTIP